MYSMNGVGVRGVNVGIFSHMGIKEIMFLVFFIC